MQRTEETAADGKTPLGEHDHGDPTKRQAIVEAARVLFTTSGYEPTTMSEVARKAGVAVGTVYLYFKNKPDLLYAVKNDWERIFLSYMASPEVQAIPFQHRARPLIEAAFAVSRQHIEMVQLMGLQPAMVGDHLNHEPSSAQQVLATMLQEAIEQGIVRPIDPKAVAVLAFGMVNQALLQCFVFEDGQNQDRYISALVDALQQWLFRTGSED